MFVAFVASFLISNFFFNDPLVLDENGMPIIGRTIVYSGIVALLFGWCLLLAAISLLLD